MTMAKDYAGWLSLAASPSFAVMAVMSALDGGGLCLSAPGSSPLSGMIKVTRVPFPGLDVTSTMPPSDSIRSRILNSPNAFLKTAISLEPLALNPCPSSATVNLKSPFFNSNCSRA